MLKRNIVVLVLALLVSMEAASLGQSRRERDRFPRNGACFFKDNNFQGDFFCMRKGESMPHMPKGFNDKISSIRIFGGANVVVFKDSNFHGRSIRFRRDVRDLIRVRNANDTVSSIQVR